SQPEEAEPAEPTPVQSAEEEEILTIPEPELTLEAPSVEAATPEATEPAPEPELTLESRIPSPEEEPVEDLEFEPAFGEEAELQDDELWSELFSTEKPETQEEPASETFFESAPGTEPETLPEIEPVAAGEPEAAAKDATVEDGGEDFWDQVFKKQNTGEADTQPGPAAAPSASNIDPTDDELWQQAFPDDGSMESGGVATPLDLDQQIDKELREDSEYDEAAYADYDDDEEFELKPRKRKLGPFVIPHGRRGDMVITGVVLVFLLLAGSVYFTLQVFSPEELRDMQTAKNDVPEGLTPKDQPMEDLVVDLTGKKSPEGEKTGTSTPSDQEGTAPATDPSQLLSDSPEDQQLLQDLADSKILKDATPEPAGRPDLSPFQAPSATSITMSTIMPVAFDPTDIRVLSFSIEMQLSDIRSAQMMRESLPVYEQIMNKTVDDFLQRKFYSEILYVKEKLQKRLQNTMNQSLKHGTVKKTKFVDFAIQ
ncbi:MAG: hypothetical protein GWM98_02710, partial [Nitrospinaceae bacterium]|nr:hypothetical protein [Nitrospinaceae bacterium]NIR53612.1 hypothetical protein [Nitrospinaceae bacterium]NIS84015.1 hypothetical protein [Nitrospinaceae bacterium]NIT80820.1 hypothetical protein [Nitrospinaceae bacterium]NIU43128.1 hypothetical protein [Nitrospinaceae bacterium]